MPLDNDDAGHIRVLIVLELQHEHMIPTSLAR